MKLMDALIEQGPSLELQRAAHIELCRLQGELDRIREGARRLPKRGMLGGHSCVWHVDLMSMLEGSAVSETVTVDDSKEDEE